LTSTQILLSIDGGGTKTDVCIARSSQGESPVVIGRSRGGPTNLNSLGVGQVIAELDKAISDAAQDADISDRHFDKSIVALPGAAENKDRAEIEKWLISETKGDVRVITDAEFVLSVAEALAPKGSAAIGLLVGTGSVAFFRRQTSLEIMRAGGWGPILGDDGSGYWIGRAALRRVLQAADEGKPMGTLAKALFETLGATTPRSLISKVHESSNTTPIIASLAPLVFSVAETGDELAREILMEAAIYVGLLVSQVVSRMGDDPASTIVACAGSVATRESVFAKKIKDLLGSTGITEVYFIDDPAFAAIQLAVK